MQSRSKRPKYMRPFRNPRHEACILELKQEENTDARMIAKKEQEIRKKGTWVYYKVKFLK